MRIEREMKGETDLVRKSGGILGLKKLISLYGSGTKSFDAEVSQWIAETPPGKVQSELQEYQAKVGVDFYNMNLGNSLVPTNEGGYAIIEEELKKHRKYIKDFYLKYIVGPARWEPERENPYFLEVQDAVVISILLSEPQPIYKGIVDKAIAGEEMTEDEIHHINQALAGGEVLQDYSEERKRYFLRRTIYFGPFAIIKALYEFVYDITRQRVEVRRCGAEDCNNIFVPYKSGREQRFCSDRCYKRTYMRERRRKKEKALVTV